MQHQKRGLVVVEVFVIVLTPSRIQVANFAILTNSFLEFFVILDALDVRKQPAQDYLHKSWFKLEMPRN